MPGTVTLYIDESGDVGFKPNSSEVFVIGYLVAGKPLRLSNDLNKLRRRLSKRLGIEIPEFKFSKDREEVRSAVLGLIAESDVTCGFVAVKKGSAIPYLQQNPDRMYNYLAVNYPIKRVLRTFNPERIRYVIDKQVWSGKRRDGFDRYVKDKASWVSVMECNSCRPPAIHLVHEDSRNDPCLQAADYLAGSVYAAITRGKRNYFEKMEGRFRQDWRDMWGVQI
ncbi:MAG: DUF3800 domain-containing protein [Candidatus Methanosuratincola verstraetei]|jgi:hypothetical protein|uniref:DUF3800 domain-containing protein n=1 Tax=Methanosuratincola subterraneus TaxID=2593994 RepID=A0A3S3VDJ4_METS7|nr:MAG: hypothetical protein Metus_0245 [Candidatus Methanosuratincola subterraneus]